MIFIRLSSRFGPRTHPVTGEKRRPHNGIDLAVAQGTQLNALRSGTVSTVFTEHPLSGYAVIINHGNGFKSSFSHLSRILVSKGQKVTPNTIIGLSGGTPETPGAGVSTGPHLHLVIRLNGKAIDPLPLIDWRGVVLTRNNGT